MKKFLFVLISLFLLSACTGRGKPDEITPPADPENLPNLSGTYVVNGVDPLGMEYSGHLTITSGDEPGSYHMQWIIIGNIQEGQGVLKGNQLFVDWQTIEGSTKASQGTAVFTITETGQLDGIRDVSGMDGEGTEQAFPNQ